MAVNNRSLVWCHSLLTLLHKVEYRQVIRGKQHLFCIHKPYKKRKESWCETMTDTFLKVTEIDMDLNQPLQSVMEHIDGRVKH